MAYSFSGGAGSGDLIRFTKPAPFVGYVFGALTIAAFYRVTGTATGSNKRLAGFTTSVGSNRMALFRESGYSSLRVSGSEALGVSHTSTSLWYLAAMTYAGASGATRYHLHDGTSWSHGAPAVGSNSDAAAVVAGDFLSVGNEGIGGVQMECVCVGIKRGSTSDAGIEALLRTSFQSWLDFGFHWLIGFETSGALTNQGTDGAAAEISRSGTALVSDPAGWAWAAATPTPVSVTRDIRYPIFGGVSATRDLRYPIVAPAVSFRELEYPIKAYPDPAVTDWVPVYSLVPVGNEGQILSYNPSEPGGLEWIDPPVSQSLAGYSDIWVWTTKTTDANTADQIGINAATWAAATQVNVSEKTKDNRDLSALAFPRFQVGDQLYLQQKTDSTRYAYYEITGAGVDHGTWWHWPVTHLRSAGALPSGNADTNLTWLVTP